MPYALQIQTCARQPAAIAIAGERVTVKTSPRLKARIPGFLPSFDAAKEGFEGPLDASQDILCRRKVRQSEMPSTTYLFELVCLIVVVQRHPALLVGIPPFLESGIIQATGFR